MSFGNARTVTFECSHPECRQHGAIGVFYPVKARFSEPGLTPEQAERLFWQCYEPRNGKLVIAAVL